MVILERRRRIEGLRLGDRCGSGGAREKDAAKVAALRDGGPGPFVPQGERARYIVPLQPCGRRGGVANGAE
jgi:hypothetical protein